MSLQNELRRQQYADHDAEYRPTPAEIQKRAAPPKFGRADGRPSKLDGRLDPAAVRESLSQFRAVIEDGVIRLRFQPFIQEKSK